MSLIILIAVIVSACSTGTEGDQTTPTPRAGGQGRPAVFVTDFGIGLVGGWRAGAADPDDAMAIALARTSDELDILGLVVTYGNTINPPQVEVATPRFLEAADMNVPVVAASQRPLADPAVTFGGREINDTCMNDGVEFLAETLRTHDDVIVFGISPLTPVACLVLNEPELAERIGDVVTLMGIEPTTPLEINGAKVFDFNFALDVRAAKVLVEQSQIPITFITFELSVSSLVTTQQIDDLRTSGGKLGTFFADNSQPWLKGWTETFKEDGFHPWDANTVWWAMRPDAFSCKETGVSVEIPSDYKFGSQTLNTAANLYVSDQYQSRRVRACTAYSSEAAKTEFVQAVLDALKSSA